MQDRFIDSVRGRQQRLSARLMSASISYHRALPSDLPAAWRTTMEMAGDGRQAECPRAKCSKARVSNWGCRRHFQDGPVWRSCPIQPTCF